METWNDFYDVLRKLLEESIGHEDFFYTERYYALDSIIWTEFGANCDFCFSVLKCKYNPIKCWGGDKEPGTLIW